MLIGNDNVPPPYLYWVPDFSDFTLPVHPDGRPFEDPADMDLYTAWLAKHLDATDLPLNPHQIEILYNPEVVEWEPEKLGGYIGYACFSQYYWFKEPRFSYPEDFLVDPRPQRVCDPATTKWESALVDEDGEIHENVIDLQTWLIFDCMFWKAKQLFDHQHRQLKSGTFVWSDIGWRPLLKVAVSRAQEHDRKILVIKEFFEEFERFDKD